MQLRLSQELIVENDKVQTVVQSVSFEENLIRIDMILSLIIPPLYTIVGNSCKLYGNFIKASRSTANIFIAMGNEMPQIPFHSPNDINP